MDYLRGLLGLAALVGAGYLLCSDRRRINWRLVGSGIVLQWLIALLLLKVPPVRAVFESVSTFFIRLLDFSRSGSEFLFANFASIGIQVGGISAIAPSQRENLVRLGLKAMIAGTIAALMTACIAGTLLSRTRRT
jgi:nucleoside permease NupC